MRVLILLSIITQLPYTVRSQNIQLHYDFGKNRQLLTSTTTMFKADNWGSSFFFIDFNYDKNKGNTVSFAYMEVSRALKFWDAPFAIQVEYDGGTSLNDAWLIGAQYTWNNPDFTRVFTIQGLYKYIKDKHNATFQITGVWGIQMLKGKFTFSGFADFWKEDNVFGTNETSFVFLSEPQLWYNVTKNFSIGGEVEISNNFGGNEGFMVNPTIGLKWNF
ncbi:MAG: DUF5020 family protein [Bacteroidales bacterium]|nr:MAG: DUF5020 family protein [Bacteroidales bacterium]